MRAGQTPVSEKIHRILLLPDSTPYPGERSTALQMARHLFEVTRLTPRRRGVESYRA